MSTLDWQVEEAKKKNEPITVKLPDGSERQAIKGVSTPLDVLKEADKELLKTAVVSKVNGEVWDLFRPLEGDCTLQVCSFEDEDGKHVRLSFNNLEDKSKFLDLFPCHRVVTHWTPWLKMLEGACACADVLALQCTCSGRGPGSVLWCAAYDWAGN